MGKVSNVLTRLFFDQYDISGALNAAQMQLKQQAPKAETFASVGPAVVVGNYDHTHSLTGFFDGSAGGFDEQAFVDVSTDADHYLAEMWGANAEGGVAYDSVVQYIDQPRTAKVGGAVMLNLNVTGRGQLARGSVLRNATLTGANNGPSINDGIIAAGQIYAMTARLLAPVVGTNVTLKLQDSADNATWADVAGMTTAALTVATAARFTTTAGVRQYKRIVASGTFTSAQVVVTGGYVAGS